MATVISKTALKGLVWLKRGADMVGVLFFLATFSGFIVQVFFRYALNQPLAWTEEATMIAYIWAVFWAAAFMVPIREHVTFDVVYELVSPRTRRIFALISMVLLVIAFLLLIPATLDYMQFLMRKKSPVLRYQMTWVYGCYFIFLIAFCIQAGWRALELMRPGWRDQI
ncbi:TRAP transporter small permease [Cucumibacter marinus]|uniref:TRAP transporter small permease n=1 Tax=Cucumibacter marinus TaxID=1121252 RepID=UPI0004064BA5|nr:TRAP transporter small permease [Cucumibacter marinus]